MKAMSLWLRNWVTKLFCRIYPKLNSFIDMRKSLFLGSAMRYATRKFWNFGNKSTILLTPV